MKCNAEKEKIKKEVRKGYAEIAKKERSCCAPADSCCWATRAIARIKRIFGQKSGLTVESCCGSAETAGSISRKIGYAEEDIKAVPDGANLGLGCGNPVALASLKGGETVLDLGSGPGFDCFLASRRVGKRGKVIGVDMTAEMIEKARENAKKGKYENVEFRLGEIENLPVADNSVDIVISNCVINLSPDKKRVFEEAYRVLKPGGRIMISDLVLLKELPDSVKDSIEAYVGCLSGAVMKDEYIRIIKNAGFRNVRTIDETRYPADCMANDPTAKAIAEKAKILDEDLSEIAEAVVSIKVCGVKIRSVIK